MTTSAPDWMQDYTGAYAVPHLVGRTELLKHIMAVVKDRSIHPRVIFLTGLGGIGKTRILSEVLREARSLSGVRVGRGLIDLYNIVNHTPSGLAESFFQALTPPSEAFQAYVDEYRMLEPLRQAGDLESIARQRNIVLAKFTESLQSLTQHQRIVLALDTAERFVYGADGLPTPITQVAEAWTWLLETLPQWRNVVLLVAGRKETELLLSSFQATTNGEAISFSVEPFTEAESLQYFDTVAQGAEHRGEREVANRVRSLNAEIRSLAHVYARGEPILLALLVDYLSVAAAGELPDLLRLSPQEAQRLSSTEREDIQRTLEAQLIERLVRTSRIGDTILALGRVPKGADDELLAGLLGVSVAEARTYLSSVKALSFVKIREVDQRTFLHDEMYALLNRQVYEIDDDSPQAAAAAEVILEYYKRQIENNQSVINEVYALIEQDKRSRRDFTRLAETTLRRQTLLTESVFYQLRQKAVAGFADYYRLAREAILSGDVALDIQLQAEILAFLRERDPDSKRAVIDELERDVVLSVVVMRPVVRAYANQEYRQLLEEAARLRREGGTILASDPSTNEAILSAWESVALTALGGEPNMALARQKLADSITHMEQLLAAEDQLISEAKLMRRRAVLALAHRVRAYLNWASGLMERAVDDYRRAAILWREVDLRIELATTLNDMGYALAELGQWSDARALVTDALNLRRQIGPRAPVGLSINTLARIDLHEGNFITAIAEAESALVTFRTLENPRGVGLALICLAEAQRRHAGTPFIPLDEEKIRLLREAREYAREAFSIFSQSKEQLRQVEALIEEGCACRNWVKLRRNSINNRDDIERLIYEGTHALQQAADIAEKAGILHRQIDALVNLAWLGLHARNETLLRDAAQKAESVIPESYVLTKGQRFSKAGLEQVLIWPQLGKLNILYGHQVLGEGSAQGRLSDSALSEAALAQATTYYLLGLQYNALYSEDYQGLRRAKEEIYEQFKGLSARHLRLVARTVQTVEAEYQLVNSGMQQLLQNRALWYPGTE